MAVRAAFRMHTTFALLFFCGCRFLLLGVTELKQEVHVIRASVSVRNE